MIAYEFFGITDNLSSALQKTSISAAEGKTMAKMVLVTLKDKRNEGDSFFETVCERAQELGRSAMHDK